jgi:hypothetical protein
MQVIDMIVAFCYYDIKLETMGKIQMKKRELKKTSNYFIQKILNKDLRILIIQAGFPFEAKVF